MYCTNRNRTKYTAMSKINTSYGVWFNREDIEKIEPVKEREFTVLLKNGTSRVVISVSYEQSYANRDELIRLIGEYDGTKECLKVGLIVMIGGFVAFCIGYFAPMILKQL